MHKLNGDCNHTFHVEVSTSTLLDVVTYRLVQIPKLTFVSAPLLLAPLPDCNE